MKPITETLLDDFLSGIGVWVHQPDRNAIPGGYCLFLAILVGDGYRWLAAENLFEGELYRVEGHVVENEVVVVVSKGSPIGGSGEGTVVSERIGPLSFSVTRW